MYFESLYMPCQKTAVTFYRLMYISLSLLPSHCLCLTVSFSSPPPPPPPHPLLCLCVSVSLLPSIPLSLSMFLSLFVCIPLPLSFQSMVCYLCRLIVSNAANDYMPVYLLLVRQMEIPVSPMKVAVHRRSRRLPYSLRAKGVWSGQIPFLSGS